MRASSPLLFISLILGACQPAAPIILPEPSPLPKPDSATSDSLDTIDPVDPIETLGQVEMEPKGGGFIGDTQVSLTVKDGVGDLQWCFSDPSETQCQMEAYTGPIPINASGVLRAQATYQGEFSEIETGVFVEVDSSMANFQSKLPVILYSLPGPAPGALDIALSMVLIEPPVGGSLHLTDAPSNTGRVRMHTRGSSSSDWNKKSWDLELWESDSNADRNDALIGMPANGDWILYAPYYFDEALIRNPLAFAISEKLGRYAPRTRFVEVFLATRRQAIDNASYQGVYVLMEEIERAADRVNITELLPGDIAEPEVSGGYLFKIDRTGNNESGFPYETGTANGTWSFQQGFVAVNPSESSLATQQTNYLKRRLDSAGNALAAADGFDPSTGLHYDEIIDTDSFIDHHIINLMMKNPDAFRLSGYMYQDRGGLIQAGPVWDFDRTAASLDDRSSQATWWDAQNLTGDCTDYFEFGWYKGLFEDPVWSARYWDRLSTLLDSDLSNAALDQSIDTLSADLSEAAARDADRWGQADFATEITQLRTWFHQRHDWMRACIDTYPDPRLCPGQ
jgi:hypothetical protein